MILLTRNFQKIHKDGKLINVSSGEIETGVGVDVSRYSTCVRGSGNVLEWDSGDGCMTLQIY